MHKKKKKREGGETQGHKAGSGETRREKQTETKDARRESIFVKEQFWRKQEDTNEISLKGGNNSS